MATSQAVNQLLDRVRGLQTVLLAACAGIWVLAVSPGDSRPYETLTTILRDINLSHPGSAELERVRENHAAYLRSLHAMNDSMLAILGPHASDTVLFPVADDRDLEGFGVSLLPVAMEDDLELVRSLGGTNLSDLATALPILIERGRSVPDEARFAADLRDAVPSWCAVCEIWTWRADWDGDGRWHVRLGFHDVGRQDSATLRGSAHGATVADSLNAELLGIVLPGQHARNRSAVARQWNDLLREFRRDFPEVWQEVRYLDRSSAIAYAQSRTVATRKTLSLFGIQIDERMAGIAGPLAVLMLLVYMHLHLQRASQILESREAVAPSHAWPPIFPGRAGRFAALAILVVIPASAVIALSVRLAMSARIDGAYLVVHLAAVIAVIVAGASCAGLVRKIRRASVDSVL